MNWVSISIALVLATVAGVLNFIVVSKQEPPLELVVVSKDVDRGDTITEEVLDRIAVRAERKILASAIPYKERAMLYERQATRDLQEGEIVLYEDVASPSAELNLLAGERGLQISLDNVRFEPELLLVGNQLGFVVGRPDQAAAAVSKTAGSTAAFEVLGPFRVVGVGARVGRQAGESTRGTGSIITVAVKEDTQSPDRLDPKSSRLVSALAQSQSGERTLAVVLYPSGQ